MRTIPACLVLLSSAVAAFSACASVHVGCEGAGCDAGVDDASMPDVSIDGNPTFPDTSFDAGDGATCDPPEVLIVLDGTQSMGMTISGVWPPDTDAGQATAKWLIGSNAVKKIIAPPLDQTIRFGLETFPFDPDDITDAGATGHCVTLANLLDNEPTGTSTFLDVASNEPRCLGGEVRVAPITSAGSQIATALDTAHLCISTNIGAAMQTAQDELAHVAVQGRKQFVMLVADGWQVSCEGDDSALVATTQALATAGVETFVVGFGEADGGAGVNTQVLNDVACAGRTATNFATTCKQSGSGYVPVNANGSPLFLSAQDGAELQSALSEVATSVCCGCVN